MKRIPGTCTTSSSSGAAGRRDAIAVANCSGIWAPDGIETLVHYPVTIPRQPALAGTHPADCPRAAAVCDEVLSLPLHPHLGDHELARIAAAIGEFSGKDRHE